MLLLVLVTLILAGVTMVIACYTDVRSRSVNSFLFLPLVVVAGISTFLQGVGPVPVLSLAGLYLFSFLSRKPIIYIAGGLAIFAMTLFFSLNNPYCVGYVLFVMIPYLIAYRERLFGVGDVKAIIALSLAFYVLPDNLMFLPLVPPYMALPFSFLLLLNSSFASIAFLPYLVALNYARGSRLGMHSLMGMEYREEEKIKNPERYSVVESSQGKFLVYRIPYMIPIAIGMLIALFTGV